MNKQSVINALTSEIRNKKTLATLRKTSKQLRNQIPLKNTQYQLKLLTNDKLIKMLSNSNSINANTNVFNIMNRIPLYKYVGTDPRNYNNVLNIEGIGVWTKKQWVIYHAISLYIQYLKTNNFSTMYKYQIDISLRFLKQNNSKRNKILQYVNNLYLKNKLKLLDFVNLMNMFTKNELLSIGY